MKLIKLLLGMPQHSEVYVRINDDLYEIDAVYSHLVVDDLGKVVPYLGDSANQKGEKRLATLIYAH